MNEEWRDRAACQGRAPLFDSSIDGESVSDRTSRREWAKSICEHKCPVRAECDAAIDRKKDSGVRGGIVLTSYDFPATEATQKRVRYPREHGSERGYNQHRNRHDLPACRECLDAHSAHLAVHWKAA